MKIKKAHPTQEEQLKKKEEMTSWAKARLVDPQTLIVDVETTGLLTKDPKTEVVSLSMIDNEGRVVLGALVNPQRPIPMEVQKIHKIDDRAVRGCPPFPAIGNLIAGIMDGRHVVAFNASFDVHLIVTLFQRYGIAVPDFEVSCAMEAYSAWIGDWAKTKESYKWQRLPKLAAGQAHDSLVDCQSTLLLLKKMAGDFTDEPNTNDISLNF